MSKQKRLCALLLGIGIMLALFVSSAYIALEADHDCAGGHCEICEHIEECRALLRSFALLVFLMAVGMAVLSGGRGKNESGAELLPVRASLVRWKVRINN